MSTRPALLLVFSLAATGCFAGSVQPWFDPSQSVEEPGAVGTWRQDSDNGGTVLNVSALPNKLYRVDMTDKGEAPARFTVALGRLGKNHWADAQLDHDDAHLKGVEGFLVRPHLALKFVLDGDKLSLHMVDKDWFKQQVDKKRVKLPYVNAPSSEQEMMLFTAPTAQLSAALKSLEKEPKAFSDPVMFSRVKP